MTDWQQLASVLAVVGAAIVAARWLWKLGRVVWHKLRTNNMFGISAVQEDLLCLRGQMDFVVSELKPNNGTSLRDSVNRIETRQVLQEQTQKAILSDMSIGVFKTDAEGLFTWVNPKYLRMTGRAPNEVHGSGWVNTIAVRDRERVQREWKEAIDDSRDFESEFLLITPDDDRVQVSARTYKMIGQEDELLGFVGMLTPLCETGRQL